MAEQQQVTEEELKNMSPEQISELQKQNCIFCHIKEGKIPAKKVYEDDICFAILDINPAAKGHMLLIPKEHYVVLPQAPEDVVLHLAKISKLLSKTALRALGAQGTNIFLANGAIAGQRAPHAMIHIIPRIEGDNIIAFELPEKSIPEEDLTKMQQALSQRLGYQPQTAVPQPPVVAEQPAPPPVPTLPPAAEEEIKKEKIEQEAIEEEKEEVAKELEEPKEKPKKKSKKKKKDELEEVGLDELADMLSKK